MSAAPATMFMRRFSLPHARALLSPRFNSAAQRGLLTRAAFRTPPPGGIARAGMPVAASRCFGDDTQASKPMSFIEKAKLLGANAILGAMTHQGGFDSALQGMNIDRIDNGSCAASLVVTPNLANAYGTLHGGCIATIIDIIGTVAIVGADPFKAGVSLEMSIGYVSAAKIGEKITCEGRVIKLGGRIAFTEVVVKGADGRVVATGRHTKAI